MVMNVNFNIELVCMCVQEKRRAERAEQQRIRAEKDKERQARREVCFTGTNYRLLYTIKNGKQFNLSYCLKDKEPGIFLYFYALNTYIKRIFLMFFLLLLAIKFKT